MSNINGLPMVMVLLLFFKVWDLAYGRTYVRTDSHVTTKIFEIDGSPNWAPLTHLRRTGAPLLGQP